MGVFEEAAELVEMGEAGTVGEAGEVAAVAPVEAGGDFFPAMMMLQLRGLREVKRRQLTRPLRTSGVTRLN